ncbi:Hypothetical predicted protein, partial [Drosophila guanche]
MIDQAATTAVGGPTPVAAGAQSQWQWQSQSQSQSQSYDRMSHVCCGPCRIQTRLALAAKEMPNACLRLSPGAPLMTGFGLLACLPLQAAGLLVKKDVFSA